MQQPENRGRQQLLRTLPVLEGLEKCLITE